MRYRFDFDKEKCSACGACVLACIDQNEIDIKNGQIPFRNVFENEEVKDGHVEYTYASTGCVHCEDAPCVEVCPVGCIVKDEETGLIVCDTSICIGCHRCAMACPYGVPSFGTDGKMYKCDGCIERVKHGMEPACSRVCPTGALEFKKR